MRVYIGVPMTGRIFHEVQAELRETSRWLLQIGYKVLYPTLGQVDIDPSVLISAKGYEGPVSCDHSITARCQWMVQQSDIVFMDLSRSEKLSVGCIFELAWANLLKKHTVVVMSEPYNHPIVRESIDVSFNIKSDAMNYLSSLQKVY